mgnify:CR=1 FL=1
MATINGEREADSIVIGAGSAGCPISPASSIYPSSWTYVIPP